ncbi:unnamed protein product [Effrenium voratum]|nr:unnamed protein product [Effrenium voratum]
MEKCPPNSFVAVGDLCEYAVDQSIRLQELPEHVPVGEMPRSIELCAQMYDVDKASPGTRLTCIGIFCATEKSAGDKLSKGRNQGTNTVKYSYIQVLGLQLAQGKGQGGPKLSAEEEEHFEHMAKDPQIREMIFKSIAPAICASEKDSINQVKRAIACLLFGGSRKQLPSGNRLRGDINVLLLGDPGTAKSQFLKFANQVAPIAVYTSGKGSSAAGLTAAIVKDGGGFTLEGGAMVLADNGLVCIDEFDKMDEKDRVAIHEAMEQQTISIAKAGMTTMLNTRCSVLAAANPRFGSYDDLSDTADQMDFQTTILSRFDMMFLVKDVRDPERDYKLAKHLVALHSGAQLEETKAPLTNQELRKYITYCRSKCSPRITKEGAEVLKNHYVAIRKAMKSEKATIPITVRQLEAIVRIAESLAKMELQEDADVSHVEEALRLFTVSTLDSANRERNGVGIDVLSDDEKKELLEAEEAALPCGSQSSSLWAVRAMVAEVDAAGWPRVALILLQRTMRLGMMWDVKGKLPWRHRFTSSRAYAQRQIAEHGSFVFLVMLAAQFGLQPLLAKRLLPRGAAASVILLSSNTTKILISAAVLLLGYSNQQLMEIARSWTFRDSVMKAGLPSALFAGQGWLLQVGQTHLDSLTFNLLNQTKTLSAALLCYLLLGGAAGQEQRRPFCFCFWWSWSKNRGEVRSLVCLVVQSSTRETHLFAPKGHLWDRGEDIKHRAVKHIVFSPISRPSF